MLALRHLYLALDSSNVEGFFDWILLTEDTPLLDLTINFRAFSVNTQRDLSVWMGIARSLTPRYFRSLGRVRIQWFAPPGSAAPSRVGLKMLQEALNKNVVTVELDVVTQAM